MPDLYTIMRVNRRIKQKPQQTTAQRALVCSTRSEFDFYKRDITALRKQGATLKRIYVPVYSKHRHGVISNPR